MDSGRLRDVLGDLVGSEDARHEYAADPAGFLAGYGYSGLPVDLIAEAVSNYTDVADPALAQHLAPMVMAYRGFGGTDAPGVANAGLDLLATAPHPVGDAAADLDGDLAAEPGNLAVEFPEWEEAARDEPQGPRDPVDLDFGSGAEPEAAPGADLGLDGDQMSTGTAGLAAMPGAFTNPLADLGETGFPQHDPAGVDGDEPPAEPWQDDALGVDGV